MQIFNPFVSKKKFKIISQIGFFTSIISNLIFIGILIYVHILSINGAYPWYEWELSELVLNGEPSKFLFDIAIIINGLGLICTTLPLAFFLPEKRIRITYLIMVSVVTLSLIGVGAFPEDAFNTIHYVVGVIFFLSASVLICYISTILQLKMKEVPLFYAIFGYITTAILVFHLTTRFFFGMAYTQRLAVLFSIIFLLTLSGYFVFGNENKVAE